MSRSLPSRPSLAQLKKLAKALQRACDERDSQALLRVVTHHPAYAGASVDEVDTKAFSLRDAQLTLAREYEADNWQELGEIVAVQAGKRTYAEVRAEGRRQQTSSADEINTLVEQACGSAVSESERILRDYSCEVHRVTTKDGQRVIYKANWYNQGPRFENERWALEQCARVGVPAPRTLHLEHDQPGYPKRSASVLSYIEGASLEELVETSQVDDVEFRELLTQAGELYARLHSVQPAGFGPLDGQGCGPFADWQSCHLGRIDLERLRQSAHNAEIDWSHVEEVLEILECGAALGEGLTPSLCHNSFNLGHIFVDKGVISGLIDFEHCEGGDPANEVSWCDDYFTSMFDGFAGETSIPVPVTPLISGYRRRADLDDAFMRRAQWHQDGGTVLGLADHGVNGVDTAGMMPFLKAWFEKRLVRAKSRLHPFVG